MPYKKKYGMRKRRPTYRPRKYIKKAVYQAKKRVFAKRVRSVVTKLAETKVANYINAGSFNLTGWKSSDFQSTIKILTPCNATGGLVAIGQGTGQGNRIGNKIQMVKCVMKGVVHINTAYDPTVNFNMCPLYVACFIFRLKGNINESQANAYNVMFNSFFQAGNTALGFNGTLVDLTRQVNTSQVTLLKKRVFKVGTQYVTSANAVGGTNTTNQQYSDGTVGISQMFKMDLTKCLPKVLNYNDTDNSPTNSLTWMAWVPYRVDGGEIKTSLNFYTGCIPAYVDFEVDYMYKDM